MNERSVTVIETIIAGVTAILIILFRLKSVGIL